MPPPGTLLSNATLFSFPFKVEVAKPTFGKGSEKESPVKNPSELRIRLEEMIDYGRVKSSGHNSAAIFLAQTLGRVTMDQLSW